MFHNKHMLRPDALQAGQRGTGRVEKDACQTD